MADIRSLLKSERAARRIQHKYSSYATGTLMCTVCRLQMKADALWEAHLRSAGHMMKVQKAQDAAEEASQAPTLPAAAAAGKKRKAASDDEEQGTTRKKNRPANGLPEGFFDPASGMPPAMHSPNEIQIPSRPATPAKPHEAFIPKKPEPHVDEDEWAAFEADIATTQLRPEPVDGVITAPAMTAADLANRSAAEEYTAKKERQEAELEGEKEDAARKMEIELDEMESLEARVKRLREKRELLRKSSVTIMQATADTNAQEEDDDDDDDDVDEWDFRMGR